MRPAVVSAAQLEQPVQESAEGAPGVGQPDDGASTRAVVERLRERIRRVQAAPRQHLVTLSSGAAELDALGAFRLGTAVELTGQEAAGRATLALSLVASAAAEKRLCAWVDGPRELYPPAALGLGVELERLLLVRPAAPGQLVWAAVQLLRSGAFVCVVLDLTRTGVHLTPADSRRLVEAARAGGALLLLLTSQLSAHAGGAGTGFLRLQLEPVGPRGSLRLVSDDGGPAGPPAPERPGDEVSVEVVRSSRGGFGQRVALRRSSLCRAMAAMPVRPASSTGLAPAHAPSDEAAFQRPRKHALREGAGPGCWGIRGNRPGRDAPFLLLQGAR